MSQDKFSPTPNPLLTHRVLLHDKAGHGPTRAARRSPPRIGRYVPKIAKAAYKKYGFSEPHILTYWTEIVGERLAKFTSPEKLSRPSSKQSAATLTIRVTGPAGLELQHREPQILEQINAYYGYRAVARLRFVRGPAKTAPRR